MEQRIREIQRNLAHNAMSGEFENLQPLVDETTQAILQLIREAQVEELETILEDTRRSYHVNMPITQIDINNEVAWATNSVVQARLAELKAKESEALGEDESA